MIFHAYNSDLTDQVVKDRFGFLKEICSLSRSVKLHVPHVIQILIERNLLIVLEEVMSNWDPVADEWIWNLVVSILDIALADRPALVRAVLKTFLRSDSRPEFKLLDNIVNIVSTVNPEVSH